jgi:hypothetical protein
VRAEELDEWLWRQKLLGAAVVFLNLSRNDCVTPVCWLGGMLRILFPRADVAEHIP